MSLHPAPDATAASHDLAGADLMLIALPEEPALLPCPFCGGEAGVLRSELNGEWRAWCLRPGAVCGIISAYRETKAAAIAAWNRRAPAEPHVERAGG